MNLKSSNNCIVIEVLCLLNFVLCEQIAEESGRSTALAMQPACRVCEAGQHN